MKGQLHIINNLSVNQQQSSYLEVAFNACIEFQTRVRREGLKTFNVWIFLQNEFKKNWKLEFKKPPKASTIMHWFQQDPVTGMKMGADDLADICYFINDYSPLIAYHEEKISRFENVENKRIPDNSKLEIKDSALELADNAGNLCGEIKSALADGKFMPHEKKDVAKAISALKNKIKTLETLVK